MANNDRTHFDDYREQTFVKHDILESYLPAYFHILKKTNSKLVFIDGFAGRGTYVKASTGEKIDGSPLRALRLIARNEAFAKKVSAIFVESDDVLFPQLEKSVIHFYNDHKEDIREPICLHGTFAERLSEVMEAVEGDLAPTFLFVDPCGVSGTNFNSIASVMRCSKCEVFIFFNIDGVRRIAGLSELSDVLVDLMGSQERAQALFEQLHKTHQSHRREKIILEYYCNAIKEDMKVEFIIPFRVEHEDKRKPSHYLIHASRHPLGFRIMKDVMWRRGRAEDKKGALELVQASRTNYRLLFDVRGEAVKEEIVASLKGKSLKVAVFCEDWVSRPTDMRCEAEYKKALLELEREGIIQILSKDVKRIVSADERPKRNGKPTLANEYFVSLANKK